MLSNFKSISGIEMAEWANAYSTPLFIYSEGAIKNKIQEIENTFLLKYPGSRAYYASKAFMSSQILSTLKNSLLGVEVSSLGELLMTLKSKFPMERVIFHGNCKLDSEIKIAICNDIGTIVIDGFEDYIRIHRIAQNNNKRCRVLVRLNIDVGNGEFYKVNSADSKFGVIPESIEYNAVLENLISDEYCEYSGLHFHLGTKIIDPKWYEMGVELALSYARKIEMKYGLITYELNIGGGFGISYGCTELERPICMFTDLAYQRSKELSKEYGIINPTLTIEPGRWIVGDACITLFRICSIKKLNDNEVFAFIDGSLPINNRPAMYKPQYEVFIANKENCVKNAIVHIGGKWCDNTDILVKSMPLPMPAIGDVLVVVSTGAYVFSKISNFLKLPRPCVVLLNKDRSISEIIPREDVNALTL